METITHDVFSIFRYRYKRFSTISRADLASSFEAMNPVFDELRTFQLHGSKKELVATAQACAGTPVWNRTYAVNMTVHQDSTLFWESVFACLQNLEACIVSKKIHGVIYAPAFALCHLPESLLISEAPPILVSNFNELIAVFSR